VKHRFGWAFPDADEFMASELGPNGEYQSSHLQAALSYVTDFSSAIEGGAHVGTFAKPLSKLFERVLAFEPADDTREALCANMAAFECENVEVYPCALGDSVGYVSLALDARATALKNTGARFVKAGGNIAVMPIDVLELETLGFLKLDVEGSEPLALEGARDTLARCRPVVLFEDKGFCQRYGQPVDASDRILASLGYTRAVRVGNDQIWAHPCAY